MSARGSTIAAFGGLELLGHRICARARACEHACMLCLCTYRIGHRRLDSLQLLGTLLLEEGAAA